MPDVREMNANLMRAAGLERHLEQARERERLEHRVMRARGAAVFLDAHLLTVAAVAADRRVDARARRGPPPHDAAINAAKLARREVAREPDVRRLALRDDEQARSFL